MGISLFTDYVAKNDFYFFLNKDEILQHFKYIEAFLF